MTSELILAISLVGALLFLLLIGLHIALAIGIVSLIGLLITKGSLSIFAVYTWDGLYSFTLTAVPLFLLMGNILAQTGINEKLYHGTERWLNRLPGALACSTIVANGIFAAMCGSSIAAAATFGRVAFPPMEKRGYDPKLALGSIAMGSILAPLIPPSLLLIVYGVWQHVSIVDLFAGAIVPGGMLIVLYLLLIVIRVKLNPSLAPQVSRVSWHERMTATCGMLPPLLVVVGVLGGMFGGIVTPTEAAAVGAFFSIIVAVGYKRFNLKIFKASIFDTLKTVSMIFFIMVMALALVHVFNRLGLTHQIAQALLGLSIGKYGIIILILAMYLVMGTFFTSWEMLFLTIGFVFPVVTELGFDPIWWGVIYVMAGEQSSVTPPIGLSLFVLRSVVPQHSMRTIALGSFPFLIPLYINMALLIAFPQLILWLPSLFG